MRELRLTDSEVLSLTRAFEEFLGTTKRVTSAHRRVWHKLRDLNDAIRKEESAK